MRELPHIPEPIKRAYFGYLKVFEKHISYIFENKTKQKKKIATV